MATTFSIDLLRGACLANKISADGTHDELASRLGAHLVSQLLNSEASAAAHVDKKKRPTSAGAAGSTPKRPMSAWHQFLRTEKELVKAAGGFHGRVEVLRECARRWRLAKRVGTSDQPLMLSWTKEDGASSSDTDSIPDGLLQALRELPREEIASSLEANGFEVDDNMEVNIMSLARSMM